MTDMVKTAVFMHWCEGRCYKADEFRKIHIKKD